MTDPGRVLAGHIRAQVVTCVTSLCGVVSNIIIRHELAAVTHACQSDSEPYPLECRVALARRQRCSRSLNSSDLNNLQVKAGANTPLPDYDLRIPGHVRLGAWAGLAQFGEPPGRWRRKAKYNLPRSSRKTTNRYNEKDGVSKPVHEPAFGIVICFVGRRPSSPQLYHHDYSGRIPGHTTRAPPIGLELETNGFQIYAGANLDK